MLKVNLWNFLNESKRNKENEKKEETFRFRHLRILNNRINNYKNNNIFPLSTAVNKILYSKFIEIHTYYKGRMRSFQLAKSLCLRLD